ncbi:hypothetical protein ACJMK2_036695 [Sinanodonta woodiana]|uniref:B box-type domain-containing protein n=1 Tax=Sinanodonta woodiana TaxID=1069815 RepID=A0ABD3WI10_SINWO
MEGELRCPACNQLYCNPLFLPCSHNVCSGCACNLQETVDKFIPQSDEGSSDSSDCPEIDKLSIVSETDSGVVCNSRPNSYVGTPSITNIFFQSSQGNVYGIKCPVCKKVNFIGEKGYQSLPKNKVLETIVHKYGENKQIHVAVKCQLCENESSVATVMCEQCEVFYCDACRDNCHPSRGPLAKHNLVDPAQGKSILRSKNKGKEAKCLEHTDEHMSMYCVTCKLPMCIVCNQDGQHVCHEVQALGQMAKAQKVSYLFSFNELGKETFFFL